MEDDDGRKTYKPEEIVAKLRQVDVVVSQGQPVAEAVCSIGVTHRSGWSAACWAASLDAAEGSSGTRR